MSRWAMPAVAELFSKLNVDDHAVRPEQHVFKLRVS